jgi:uncharacterized protein DUF6338
MTDRDSRKDNASKDRNVRQPREKRGGQQKVPNSPEPIRVEKPPDPPPPPKKDWARVVPTTLIGLVLFVILLSPGLCYALVKEARRPQREVSIFRETAAVVLVGFGCVAAVLLLFSLVRSLIPERTPDVGAFVRDPAAYFQANVPEVAAWSFGMLAVACALGLFLAFQDQVPFIGSRFRLGPIRHASAWYIMGLLSV